MDSIPYHGKPEPSSSVAVIPEEGKAETILLQVSIFSSSEALSHHASDKPSDCFTELTSAVSTEGLCCLMCREVQQFIQSTLWATVRFLRDSGKENPCSMQLLKIHQDEILPCLQLSE